ncbi:MAG: hypothetical protein JST53_00285 [Actinobacteria bacterium]|nr:hypothetical protein [Actinomycetota bacterium]
MDAMETLPLFRRRRAWVGAVGVIVLLVALAAAGPAAARETHRFHRGHLPSIGQIKLVKKHGRAVITVPVAYTQALSGKSSGLESAEVTLHIASRIKHRRAFGVTATRVHEHHLAGSGVLVDRFRLDPKTSKWLFARGAKERGKLVRVDVRHRIKLRRGEPPLHEKDASLTMASSHRARPQGENVIVVMHNATQIPLKTASEPILCMYTNGEEGSNLQWFTSPPGAVLGPEGTIEAEIEADGSIFDSAEYLGGTDESAGRYFDWTGLGLDAITTALDVELTPVFLAIDVAEHCDAQASTFMMIAAAEEGQMASSEAYVLTSETCRHGCVHTNLPTAAEALDVQGVGEEEVNPGEWAHDSTEVLKGLVGGWRSPPVGGKVVQDQGLHWDRQELPEVEEEYLWGAITTSTKVFELSIHEGSSPAGYSG